MSPLVIVPKKNGKFRVYIDYIELNKATKKQHFPFPFIDQVLDVLVGKTFIHFWMDSTSIVKSRTTPKIRIRPLSHDHKEPFPIGLFHLVYVMPLLPFKGLYWACSLILYMTQWRSIWMISHLMNMFSKMISPTYANFCKVL